MTTPTRPKGTPTPPASAPKLGEKSTAQVATAPKPAATAAAQGSTGSGGSSPASLPSLSTAYPLVLLPLRIETRYLNTPGVGMQLYLRVFPDQIHVNSLQYGLSASEQVDQAQYSAAVSSGADLNALQRSLVARYGLPRAEWIVAAATGTAPTADLTAVMPSTPCFGGLPQQFVLFAYDTATSTPTPAFFPHSVAPDLAPAPSPSNLVAGNVTQLPIDPDALWLSDFPTAQASGMAMIYPGPGTALSAQEVQNGFYRLVVLGIVADGTPADGQQTLEALLNAHRYSDGLSLVAQGTPTKNSVTARAGLSTTAAAQEQALAVAFAAPSSTPPGFALDGQVLANALGIDPAVFTNVPGALGTDHQDALDMKTALWPGTAGYYLGSLLGTPTAEADWVEQWVQLNVFGRGGVPALRAGNTPYGVLPATSITRWPPSGANPPTSQDQALLLLGIGRKVWMRSVAQVPRVGLTNNPDADLLQTMAMTGTPVTYWGRYFFGPNYLSEAGQFTGAYSGSEYLEAFETQFIDSIEPLLTALGLPQWTAFITQLCGSYQNMPLPYSVRDDGVPLSETGFLPAVYTNPSGGPNVNYIAWLANASIESVSQNQIATSPPNPILYALLRFSLLLEASSLFPGSVTAPTPVGLGGGSSSNPQSSGSGGSSGGSTTSDPQVVPLSSAEFQWGSDEATSPTVGGSIPGSVANTAVYGTYVAALQNLAQRTTAELGRLLGETIDIFSTRYDAWVTSFAYSRLQNLASVQAAPGAAPGAPSGLFLGAYGWVDQLPAPGPAPTAATITPALQSLNQQLFPGGNPPPILQPSANDGGFIFAPSLDQAATGAVLRTAYLTHFSESNGSAFAIDLSSRRVRWALELLQGSQQGYSMGALLGYRFEELLGNDQTVAGFIPYFRSQFPLHPDPPTPTSSTSQIPPQVTNGLQLQRAFAAQTPAPSFWNSVAPSSSPAQQSTLTGYLEDLSDLVDAVGDVTLAEGIFQMLRGNPTRSGAAMDVLGAGTPPPEIEVVQTPVSGTRFDHRVLLLLGPNARGTTIGGPRANAEPRLEAWLEGLLPSPSLVCCTVTFQVPPGAGPAPTQVVTWANLEVGALDLLSMAGTQDTPQDAELERRIIAAALALQTGPLAPYLGAATISYAPQPNWPPGAMPFSTLLPTLRLLRDLIGAARPLTPSDVYVPSATRSGLTDPNMNVAELWNRAEVASSTAGQAATALTTAIANLQAGVANPVSSNLSSLQSALEEALAGAAAFGVPGAMPPSAPVPPSSVTGLTVAAAVPAGGSNPTWTITFTPSPVGALTAPAGSITVTGPPGTVLPAPISQNANYALSAGGGASAAPALVRRPLANQVVIYPASNLAAAVPVTITIQGVTPPTIAGAYYVNLWTSADAQVAISSSPVAIGNAASAGVTASSSVQDPRAGTLAFQFTLGPSGLVPTPRKIELPGRGTETEVGGRLAIPATIILAGPSWAKFPTTPSSYVLQATTATGTVPVTLTSPPAVSGASAVLTVEGSIAPSAVVNVEVSGVSAPDTPGMYAVSFATSSQPTMVPAAVLVDGSAALIQQADSVLTALNSRIGTATGDLGLAPSITGAIQTLQALFGPGFPVVPLFSPWDPTSFGTGFPTAASFLNGDSLAIARWVQQNTYVHAGLSQADLALSVAALLQGQAGQTPTWLVGQLPPLPNDRWLALPLPPRLANLFVTPGTPAADGTSVYTIQFTTSPTGQLASGGTVTLIAPAGTVWPALNGQNYSVQVVGGPKPTVLGTVTVAATPNQVTITVADASIGSSCPVVVTIAGVTSPIGSTTPCCLIAYTSSDLAGAPSASYTLGGTPSSTPPATPGAILPNAARVSFVAMTGPGFNPSEVASGSQPVGGLYLDGWMEEIPDPNLVAGVAVHHPDPRGQAPQVWLLAVAPPVPGLSSWTANAANQYDLALAIVNETLDLVKMRGVDLSTLQKGGLLLPTNYVPINATGWGGLGTSPPGTGSGTGGGSG